MVIHASDYSLHPTCRYLYKSLVLPIVVVNSNTQSRPPSYVPPTGIYSQKIAETCGGCGPRGSASGAAHDDAFGVLAAPVLLEPQDQRDGSNSKEKRQWRLRTRLACENDVHQVGHL